MRISIKGSNGNYNAQWPMYFFCKKILTTDSAVFDQFQVCIDGVELRYEFKKDYTGYVKDIGSEISKEEYEQAFADFKNKL